MAKKISTFFNRYTKVNSSDVEIQIRASTLANELEMTENQIDSVVEGIREWLIKKVGVVYPECPVATDVIQCDVCIENPYIDVICRKGERVVLCKKCSDIQFPQ
jgi:hypothetical protein